MKRRVTQKVDALLLLANNYFITQTVKLQQEQMELLYNSAKWSNNCGRVKLNQLHLEMTPKGILTEEVTTRGCQNTNGANDADGGHRACLTVTFIVGLCVLAPS